MLMCQVVAMVFSSSNERPMRRPSRFFTQSPIYTCAGRLRTFATMVGRHLIAHHTGLRGYCQKLPGRVVSRQSSVVRTLVVCYAPLREQSSVRETADGRRPRLQAAHARGLVLLCARPA